MTILTDSVLIESKSARDNQLVNVSHDQAAKILAKVKSLYFALWQGTGIASTEQVADFYEVPAANIRKAVEERHDKRPVQSDLRASGRLEEDADVILFLYRDAYYNLHTSEPDVMEIICTKHRNGPTATVKLLFDGTYSRLRNLATGRG